MTWSLPGNPRRAVTSTTHVFSRQRHIPSAIVNNYYGVSRAPVPVYRTSFLALPGLIDVAVSLYGIASGSTLINWETTQSVEVKVLGFESHDITIFTFLVGTPFI